MNNKISIWVIEEDTSEISRIKKIFSKNFKNIKWDIFQELNPALSSLKSQSNHKPDLILIDLKLAKDDGNQFFEIIKSNQGLKNVLVIILTSILDDSDITLAYDLGFKAVITKPISKEKVEAIQDLISFRDQS